MQALISGGLSQFGLIFYQAMLAENDARKRCHNVVNASNKILQALVDSSIVPLQCPCSACISCASWYINLINMLFAG